MKSQNQTAKYKRNFGLDILRFTAIVIVLMNHGYIGFFIGSGLSKWGGWQAIVSVCAVFSIEWLLVLGGYLIGAMMIRSFEVRKGWMASARDFWARRWFRTVPNYYAFLAFNMVLLAWGVEKGAFDWKFLVFSQSLAWPQDKPYFYSESWSLALDEWFYFLTPVLLGVAAWIFRKSRKNQFLAVALLLIIVPALARIGVSGVADVWDWDERVRRISLLHLDSTGWGVLAAIMNRWHSAWWHSRMREKAWFGLALTLLAIAGAAGLMTYGWQVFAHGRLNDLVLIVAPAAGMAFMLPWLSSIRPSMPWQSQFMTRAADYSYSIYLAHLPVQMLMLHLLHLYQIDVKENIGFFFILWILLVVGLSMLVFHVFEKPVSDLRDRFTKKVEAGPFGMQENT